MKRILGWVMVTFTLALMAACGQSRPQPPATSHWNYPVTRTVDASDTYFGKTYKDPYRWLENLKDKSVEDWFKSEAKLTDDVLARIPARDALAQEWMNLDKLKPASYSAIAYEHGRVFYKKTLGGENVGKLYFRQGWKGEERLLLDPAEYKPQEAKAGAVTTIESIVPSPDGRYVVMGFSSGGAEYSEIRILDVDSRKMLSETMYPSYGPLGWTMDSKSFFYDAGRVTDIKSPEIELNRKTRLHKLGADVATDVDLFSNESHPELGIAAKEMPTAAIDESYPDYVIGNVSTAQNEMKLFYAPTSLMKSNSKLKWTLLAKESDNLVRGLAFYKNSVYAVTHTGAPKYKVVRTSIDHPDWQKAETVIPEDKDSIQSITKSKSFLFVVYSDGILGRIVKYSLNTGKSAELKLPTSGTVAITCPDFRSNQCIVFTTSWIEPTTLYDLDGDKDTFEKSIFNTAVSYPGFDQLVTEEVEVPGHDGVMIPLSIIHRKDLKLDGSASAIIEGYGAYGISYTPSFKVRHSIALRGVVLAYAHVRGGSEKGEAWYKAGYKTTKPNTWKDFISCAEYLVKKGYTSPGKLAGTGTSAGGILISRAITERPDLFAAAVCNVGVADALRAEFSPNGPVNTPEFGTVQNQEEAQALYEMDGVQHVQPATKYPGVLGVAGWNDPRVVPWLPGKFIAALQTASTSGKPVFLKVNYDDGHFTEEKIVTFKNFAGQFAFLLWQTGHKDFQPAS
jgi:prolyl oligopeptidase